MMLADTGMVRQQLFLPALSSRGCPSPSGVWLLFLGCGFLILQLQYVITSARMRVICKAQQSGPRPRDGQGVGLVRIEPALGQWGSALLEGTICCKPGYTCTDVERGAMHSYEVRLQLLQWHTSKQQNGKTRAIVVPTVLCGARSRQCLHKLSTARRDSSTARGRWESPGPVAAGTSLLNQQVTTGT